jgi:hypothetical protein
MEELEQPTVENEGSKELGKFKDANSLLKAYNSLQAEFTKKSQKLAQLENDNERMQNEQTKKVEQEKEIEEFVSKFEIAKPFSSALKASLQNNSELDIKEETLKLLANTYKTAVDYSQDEEFLNNYIFSNQEIKDKIIKDYLSKITQNSPIKMDNGGGSISLTPAKKPATIVEASKLAKSIIKQK